MDNLAFDPDAYLKQNKTGDGFDPDAYLADQDGKGGGSPPISFVAKQVLNMTPMAHPIRNLPLLGAILGPAALGPAMGAVGLGSSAATAAAGAGLGQIAKDAVSVARGDPNAPTAPGAAAFSAGSQALGAGLMQEPRALKEIPGVSKVTQMASDLASKTTNALARGAETLTGLKARDVAQAAKQGISTYLNPSLGKATEIFGEALGPEGQKALKVPAEDAFDAALGRARGIAKDVGTRLENGKPISSIDALKARQATDRIISSTPVTDKLARRSLYDWRSKFDDIISSQNGPLKEASNTYRKAIVKDKILNLTRLNKSGEPSAFLPMLAGHGAMAKGLEAGLGMLTMTSPAVAGLLATTGGSTARGINSIAQNPQARQVLLQVLQKLKQGKQSPE